MYRANTNRPPQPVVWINGLPAVGKQTVAQCLAQILGTERAVVIDDTEFTDQLELPPDALVARGSGGRSRGESMGGGGGSSDGGGLPEPLAEKQDACFRKYVADPAALHRTVIFTDCCANNASGAEGARRYAEAARRANRPFVPVYMECHLEEHERRTQTSERLFSPCGSSIISNPEAVRELQARTGGRLYTFLPEEWPGLYVNVTEQGMHDTAMEILAFVNEVSEKRSDAVAATAAAAASRRPDTSSDTTAR